MTRFVLLAIAAVPVLIGARIHPMQPTLADEVAAVQSTNCGACLFCREWGIDHYFPPIASGAQAGLHSWCMEQVCGHPMCGSGGGGGGPRPIPTAVGSDASSEVFEEALAAALQLTGCNGQDVAGHMPLTDEQVQRLVKRASSAAVRETE